MAEVVLFHHAQGLTPGANAFADELRRAGHAVHTPDLFEGRTFDTVEEGVSYAEELGFGEVTERGVRAVEGLPAGLVYAGFSLGVLPAQRLAQTRPGARGALLFHSCVPVSEFSSAWPDGVSVQVHAMNADPFFVGEDMDAARALVDQAKDAKLFPLSRRAAPLRRQLTAAVRPNTTDLWHAGSHEAVNWDFAGLRGGSEPFWPARRLLVSVWVSSPRPSRSPCAFLSA